MTSFHQIRQKQINTLKIFNENVSEIEPDRRYRIDFVSGSKSLSMLVTLGPRFPEEKPEIRINPPPISHRWTDRNGIIVRAPGLLHYNGHHSDLGRVVQVIKRDFELNPPEVAVGREIDISPSISSSSSATTSLSPKTPPSTAATKGATFPELRNLSTEDLAELNSDPDRLRLFYETSLQRKTSLSPWIRTEENLMRIVDGLERDNQALNERLEAGRCLYLKKCDETLTLKTQLRETVTLVSDLNAQVGSVEDLRDRLRVAYATAEDTSDHIAERFLEGEFGTDVEKFAKEYIAVRRRYHEKKCLAEKFRTS